MRLEQESYRSFLRHILAERMSKNARYSLHAFAASVGVAQGFLSEVLNGKKNLSAETAAKISGRLGLTPEAADHFHLLVQLASAKNPDYRQALLDKISARRADSKIFDLGLDAFRVISDWYHFPIVDFTEMEDFEYTPRNISIRLGISQVEVEAAIDRLMRLELLERTPEGKYRKTRDHFLAEAPAQNEGILRFHRQIIEKLVTALSAQKKNERLSRTEVLLVDPDLYPEVEKIMDRAAEEIIALALRSKRKTRVCALGLHFFNLTPEREKRS
jgi:uncharacterized protein (TIGR02147 family)